MKIYGAEYPVLAYGDTADELEAAALADAVKFFGPDRKIGVKPDYRATLVGSSSVSTIAQRSEGKTRYATITVAEVLPGEEMSEEQALQIGLLFGTAIRCMLQTLGHNPDSEAVKLVVAACLAEQLGRGGESWKEKMSREASAKATSGT
jgi:hypothetical protein